MKLLIATLLSAAALHAAPFFHVDGATSAVTLHDTQSAAAAVFDCARGDRVFELVGATFSGGQLLPRTRELTATVTLAGTGTPPPPVDPPASPTSVTHQSRTEEDHALGFFTQGD